MKTPIERITEYINDRDTENRNPITMLKELRARILQDKIIAQKTYKDGMNDAIKICETLDDGKCNFETHLYYEGLDTVKNELQKLLSDFLN